MYLYAYILILLQYIIVYYSILQYIIAYYNILQSIIVYCIILHYITLCYISLYIYARIHVRVCACVCVTYMHCRSVFMLKLGQERLPQLRALQLLYNMYMYIYNLVVSQVAFTGEKPLLQPHLFLTKTQHNVAALILLSLWAQAPGMKGGALGLGPEGSAIAPTSQNNRSGESALQHCMDHQLDST